MRECDFRGCTQKHYGHGYCQRHWNRWRKHGDPSVVLPRRRRYESAASRIARQSRPDGECIVFTGGRASRSGHRQISYGGRSRGVHRVAYELEHGPIPPDRVVMHRCDNPPCVKREHLTLGTVADNNHDRDRKGRHRALPGSTNGFARLQEWQVAAIKARLGQGASTYALAAEYDVHQGTIWSIKAGHTWARVAPAPDLAAVPR